MRQRTFIIGIIFVVLVAVGSLFKILDLPGAFAMLALSALFTLAFSVFYLIDKISIERNREARISVVVLSLALLLVILSSVSTLLHWPLSGALGYMSVIIFSVYLVFFTRYTEGRKLKLQKDRQLASILFTDIVGFTSMMGQNEDKTLLALDRNRTIQKRLIRKYRGKWIKEMGDGSISIFFTASEAVLCAIAIQKEIQAKEDFSVRMGIHVSEILFTDKDIFGDGVNVASRISSIAGANEICFSNVVFQNIRNREDLKIEDQGVQNLKNVAYDVRVFRLVV
ncbi:MAG: adenylate/guanylate cyclase domain-containing protein [Bacteroidetes bacterium]|nr:adenylate/guanylate cyclase domain-containing protein [Bacteroidota bacterium]